METVKKTAKQIHTKAQPHKKKLIIGALIVLVIAVPVLTRPRASVEAFCTSRQEEAKRIGGDSSQTITSAIFPTTGSGDAGEYARAFGRLERVAPDDVKDDIHTLRISYEKIDEDPSSMMSVAFGAMGAEDNAERWVKKNCTVEQSH